MFDRNLAFGHLTPTIPYCFHVKPTIFMWGKLIMYEKKELMIWKHLLLLFKWEDWNLCYNVTVYLFYILTRKCPKKLGGLAHVGSHPRFSVWNKREIILSRSILVVSWMLVPHKLNHILLKLKFISLQITTNIYYEI